MNNLEQHFQRAQDRITKLKAEDEKELRSFRHTAYLIGILYLIGIIGTLVTLLAS